MTNENIRICRLYCGLSYETAAEAVGIAVDRYKNIETGKAEPTETELEKIAKIYNVYSASLQNDFNEGENFRLKQDVDTNLFASEELREAVRLNVTALSAMEKKLIMLLRSKENSEAEIEKIISKISVI